MSPYDYEDLGKIAGLVRGEARKWSAGGIAGALVRLTFRLRVSTLVRAVTPPRHKGGVRRDPDIHPCGRI
jgi:hypothetical protein